MDRQNRENEKEQEENKNEEEEDDDEDWGDEGEWDNAIGAYGDEDAQYMEQVKEQIVKDKNV